MKWKSDSRNCSNFSTWFYNVILLLFVCEFMNSHVWEKHHELHIAISLRNSSIGWFNEYSGTSPSRIKSFCTHLVVHISSICQEKYINGVSEFGSTLLGTFLSATGWVKYFLRTSINMYMSYSSFHIITDYLPMKCDACEKVFW